MHEKFVNIQRHFYFMAPRIREKSARLTIERGATSSIQDMSRTLARRGHLSGNHRDAFAIWYFFALAPRRNAALESNLLREHQVAS